MGPKPNRGQVRFFDSLIAKTGGRQKRGARAVTYNYDNAGRLGDRDGSNLAFTGNLGDGSSTPRTYSRGIIYDAAGRMTQEQFGTTTAAVYNKLFYNSRGQMAEILASTSGNDTTFNRGKIVNDYSLQCGGVTCNATDNNGNLRKQTVFIPHDDQNSNPTSWYQQYDYDSLNRLQRVHEYTGNTNFDWQQEYVYDRYGNRSINGNSNATWGNGINNNQAAVVQNTTTNRIYAPGETEQSHPLINYDAAGNQTQDTYSASAVLRLYDAENRMAKETQAGSYVAGEYSYDGDGRRVKRVVGGIETWQVYGIGGELIAEYAATNPNPAAPQKEYGYRNGQLLVTLTCVTGGGSPTYTYNPLESEASIVHAVDITELRTAVNQARAHAGLSAATWTDSSLSGVQIKAVHITELRTKLDEARLALGLSAVSWTDASLSGVTVKAIHISELRTKAAETIGTIDIRWLVSDQLGTPRMIFDQSGSLTVTQNGNYVSGMIRHDYLPFGEELFAGTGGRTTAQGYSASDGVRQHFTGQQRDTESGLDYFGARYYNGAQGRFTSPDPLMASARTISPQTWNRYSYALNKPLNLIDPSGLAAQSADGGCSAEFGRCDEEDTATSAEKNYEAGLQHQYNALAATHAAHSGDWDTYNELMAEDSTLVEQPQNTPEQQQPEERNKADIQIDTITYLATINGLKIRLLATVRNSHYQHFNWVQFVTSNPPLQGDPADVPVIDRDPGQQTPFYWNPTQQTNYENQAQAEGGSTIFVDFPTRHYDGAPVYWRAKLYLVGIRADGTYDGLRSYSYGFTMDANGVHPQPLRRIR